MTDRIPHQKARRICIYLGESDRWRGKPLYAALLDTLKEQGIAGATVLRGVAGFGGWELYVRFVRKLCSGEQELDDIWNQEKEDMETKTRTVARSKDAKHLRREFPELKSYYRGLF
mgnify:CR=1 FL=1